MPARSGAVRGRDSNAVAAGGVGAVCRPVRGRPEARPPSSLRTICITLSTQGVIFRTGG